MSFSSVSTISGSIHKTVTPASNKDVATISVRSFGEGVATANVGVEIEAPTAITPGATSSTELFNSRCPAIGSNVTGATGGNKLIEISVVEWSYQSWVSNYRNRIIAGNNAGDNESLNCFAGTGAVPMNFDWVLAEEESPSPRPVRRQSRKGYCFIMGNTINNHQKTGGGAFQMHAPHFNNDCLWIDPTAWRNGMNQSDVWNIQLFGIAATPNVRVGRQRAHAMLWWIPFGVLFWLLFM